MDVPAHQAEVRRWKRRMSTDDEVTRLLADSYDVTGLVGRGGMASVYSAVDQASGRRVAIKVLDAGISIRMARERFHQEIVLGSTLDHPHIVPILGSGEVDGLTYHITPLLEGETLRARLRERGRLEIPEAMGIGNAVLDAIGYAHERGVLHRDIKPENIFCSADGVQVLDFGFARAMSAATERLTLPGEIMGTPLYMSPEQAMGRRKTDPTMDLYALACVLYEMLAGAPPFVGSVPEAVIVRRINQEPPSLRAQRPEVPARVEAAVFRALAWKPGDRFQSATEMARALADGGA